MPSNNTLGGAYLFKTPERLARAKADLLGYVITHGLPAETLNYVASRFKERVGTDSPVSAALDAWHPPSDRAVKLFEAFGFLRQSIYHSELHFQTSDRFEAQLAALSASAPQPETPNATVPPPPTAEPQIIHIKHKKNGVFGRVITLIWLVTMVWIVGTCLMVWQAHTARHADKADSVRSYRIALSDLSVSLPLYYARCSEDGRGMSCSGGARAERDLLAAQEAAADLIATLAPDQAARALTAMKAQDCGTQPAQDVTHRTTHALCQMRLRLSEHLLCVTRPSGIDLNTCIDTARLGVMGTAYEKKDSARPVNVFTQQLELPEELRGFAELVDALPRVTGFADMAEDLENNFRQQFQWGDKWLGELK